LVLDILRHCRRRGHARGARFDDNAYNGAGDGSMTIALWVLAIALIVMGLIGVVLPALPGTVLIFAGILLAAWIDGFARISAWTLGMLGVLTLLSFACDLLAGALGARRLGASRQAMIGAAIGTLLGVFTGLLGLIFMPLIGAAIGEYLVLRDLQRAGQVGVATWVGLMVGTAVKVAIAFIMIGVFVAALLIR
jgi:uncharacterized protein YqgC (DUF456 family)